MANEGEQFVTLEQAAHLIGIPKRTIDNRRKRKHADAPQPAVTGKGRRPSQYRWSELKPWLERVFKTELPDVFVDKEKGTGAFDSRLAGQVMGSPPDS